MSDDLSKLRMAAPESAEQLAKHAERDRRTLTHQREAELGQSLAGFRVGSVKYLNAVPLTRGMEDEVTFATPAELAAKLRRDELDAALVSITEVLFTDRYDVLDGAAIASLGEVQSVLLAHRKPIEEAREVFCDTASLTSVNLLKVLLAERGLKPEFKPLESYAAAKDKDFVLLIGDPALDFVFANPGTRSNSSLSSPGGGEGRGEEAAGYQTQKTQIPSPQPSPRLGGERESEAQSICANSSHEIFDLGAAWLELTQLPFVYAVWALRRGMENRELRRQLIEAKDFGMDTLDHIISSRKEYTQEFRKDYLGWHIHYHLGADEKRGIAKFIELLRKHGFGPIFEPKFVG